MVEKSVGKRVSETLYKPSESQVEDNGASRHLIPSSLSRDKLKEGHSTYSPVMLS